MDTSELDKSSQPGGPKASPGKFEPFEVRYDLVAVLVVAAWLMTPSVVSFFAGSGENPGNFGDTFGAVNALFSGLAFLGVLYNLDLQRKDNERHWKHQEAEAAEKQSLFYLESAAAAYERAKELLEGGSNSRAIWIEAGRFLAHAKELATLVTETAHKRVLELHQLRYRTFFHRHLQSHSAAFYYGTDLPDLMDAARKSSDSRGGATGIAPESIRAVWDAAQFPQAYLDTLGAGFSDDELERLTVLFPGAAEYLAHKRTYTAYGGKLFDRVTGALIP